MLRMNRPGTSEPSSAPRYRNNEPTGVRLTQEEAFTLQVSHIKMYRLWFRSTGLDLG
jgi:hypothetical protein